jgi:enoyl-CoA hydratase/carnithine racemase
MLGRCSRVLAGGRALGAAPAARAASSRITGKRERFRYDNEYNELVIKGTDKWAKFLNEPYFVQHFPGSRFVELMKPKIGNPLSGDLMKKLVHEFLTLEQNHAVNTTIFGTNIDYGDVFSNGLCEKALQYDRHNTLNALYDLSRVIETHTGNFTTILGCKMSGTVVGLLLNAKYRIGAPSLEVRVDELTRGYVPGGGMAYHFASKAGVSGLMMARYLAYSQRPIQGLDLYEMGLLTHLVMENPHFNYCNALGHSIGSESQIYQNLPAHADAVQSTWDSMHVGDDEGQEDPLDDQAWDAIMLIKIQKVDMDKIKHHKSDIEKFYDKLAACFNAPTLDEAVQRVAGAAPEVLVHPLPFGTVLGLNQVDNSEWTAETLLSLEQCDPLAAKAWYKLTELSAYPSISQKDALTLEKHINMAVLRGRKNRMAKFENVDRGVGPSDRKTVIDNIVARLATVSSSDVDALFADCPIDLSKLQPASDRIRA